MRAAYVYLAGFLTAASGLPSELSRTKPGEATIMAASAVAPPGADRPTSVSILRASDGLFYLRAGVASGEVRFLVDTGASHVVLSHADALKIRSLPLADGASRIQTAGGRVLVDWVVIDRLEIEGHILHHVRAAVPRSDIGVSLLGQNALSQFSALQINGDELVLNR